MKFKVKLHESNMKIKTTGWPTKMSLFFFDNNFYKNEETFKIFSPQILEVYRILWVETTLESMFYYTFSVINTMFVSCTALLRTIKLSTTLLSISCAIRLISFLMMSSLICGLFSQLCLSGTPLENSQAGWDLGNRMARVYRFDVKWVCPMGSYAWGIQVRTIAVYWNYSADLTFNLNFLIKSFFYTNKKSRLKLKHLENEKSYFQGHSLKQIKHFFWKVRVRLKLLMKLTTHLMWVEFS